MTEMRPLSRRQLIVGFGSLGACGLLLGVTGLRLGTPSQGRMEAFVGKVVRYHLPDVQISDAAIQQFAGDFVDRVRPSFIRNRPVTLLSHLPYGTFRHAVSLLGDHRVQRSFKRLESEILTKFMFSTGYFEAGASEHPKLAYKGFHDPHELGCGNPLAQLVDT